MPDMNVSEAGRRGGRSRSASKQRASKKNGARGGRPSRAQALLKRIQEMRAKIINSPLIVGIDPEDLDLIVERLCREPDDRRRFFLRPSSEGRYVF